MYKVRTLYNMIIQQYIQLHGRSCVTVTAADSVITLYVQLHVRSGCGLSRKFRLGIRRYPPSSHAPFTSSKSVQLLTLLFFFTFNFFFERCAVHTQVAIIKAYANKTPIESTLFSIATNHNNIQLIQVHTHLYQIAVFISFSFFFLFGKIIMPVHVKTLTYCLHGHQNCHTPFCLYFCFIVERKNKQFDFKSVHLYKTPSHINRDDVQNNYIDLPTNVTTYYIHYIGIR